MLHLPDDADLGGFYAVLHRIADAHPEELAAFRAERQAERAEAASNQKTKRRSLPPQASPVDPPPPAPVPPETAPTPARRPGRERAPHPYWNRRPTDHPHTRR